MHLYKIYIVHDLLSPVARAVVSSYISCSGVESAPQPGGCSSYPVHRHLDVLL